MALPIVLLGATVAGVLAGNQLSKNHHRKSGVVGSFPGDSKIKVKPKPGSIMCCGIYGVFEHSGLWVEGNIVELSGNGLIRAVSATRFLQDRSGEKIYIACDHTHTPLCDEAAILRAASQLYQYRHYNLIKNNCNRFVAECLSGTSNPITSFTEFNYYLNEHFKKTIYWLEADLL